MQMILASGSPRRKELMTLAGYDFEIRISRSEETADPALPPQELVQKLARQKAEAVFQKDALIIGADTVVALENEILGKPDSRQEACAMLKKLSGRTHAVYTGVCMLCNDRVKTFFSRSLVKFYDLSEEEIDEYVASAEPMDKAGAYGIQGKGALLVEKIDGDYFNIVGLPIARLARELKAFI